MAWGNITEEIGEVFAILQVPEIGGNHTLQTDGPRPTLAYCKSKTCKRCKKRFSTSGISPQIVYCGKCRKLRHPERKIRTHPTNCQMCGTRLPTAASRGAVRYVCSRRCERARHKASKK